MATIYFKLNYEVCASYKKISRKFNNFNNIVVEIKSANCNHLNQNIFSKNFFNSATWQIPIRNSGNILKSITLQTIEYFPEYKIINDK